VSIVSIVSIAALSLGVPVGVQSDDDGLAIELEEGGRY
jgi:hypothetical protein